MPFIIIYFTGRRKKPQSTSNSSSTGSSRISAEHMKSVILMKQNRKSTYKTYMRIWRQFNRFLIQLDVRPESWEQRTMLFMGHLIEKGSQSSTIKSYISAIKKVLTDDGYEWNEKDMLLASLTKACRLVNDRVRTRLGISSGLLDLILFEIHRIFGKRQSQQPYLEIMYQALFALGYYGLMRIRELMFSKHVVKAANIHIAENKCKVMIALYSSKTHGEANRPQKIRITKPDSDGKGFNKNFCPFNLLQKFLRMRGDFDDAQETFFIFRDGSPVFPHHAHTVLRAAI